MEIYTIKNKSEFETDFITNILDNEKIPYKLKPIKQQRGFFEPPVTVGYNIELHTDSQHYEYFTRILSKEKSKYVLTQTQDITDIPKIIMLMIIPLPEQQKKIQKSLLKKIVDWIRGEK